MKLVITLVLSLITCCSATAAEYFWNVPSPGANNWNVPANWSPSGTPGAADTATFGDWGYLGDPTNAVNNIVSVNTTVSVLKFTNIVYNTWHVTEIPAGVTLSVTNLTVGGMTADVVSSAAMAGGGTLAVYGNLNVGNSGVSGDSSYNNLYLSGLSNFVVAAPSGLFQLGIGNRSFGAMNLADKSNNITATTMNLNALSTSSAPTGTPTVNLGAGTNIINVGALNLANARSKSTLKFLRANGGLRLRGVGGTDADRATVVIGNRTTSGTGGTTTGTMAFNGHPVDVKFSTLTLGQGGATGTGRGNIGEGIISFDTGVIDATGINMAIVTSVSNCNASATINVGANAQLIVGSSGISMANMIANSPNAPTGTLNITNGSVICSNSITKASTGGTAAINLVGGSLALTSGTIGSPSIPIDALTIGDAVLSLAVAPNATNVVVSNLTPISTTNNVIDISALPVIFSFPAQFPLIRYTGGWSDFQLRNLPAGYSGSLVTGAGSVDLLITSGSVTAHQLVWNGTPTGNWDTSTLNWLYSGNPFAYAQDDYVTFNDSASGSTTVNLTTSLTPGSLTVSNLAKNYTFSGTGSLNGVTSLVKDGSGQLTLANTGINTFSNGVSIQGGTVLLSGAPDRLPTNSIVTLADVSSAKLDLNNLNQTVQSLNGGGYVGGNLALGSATLTDWGGGTYGGVLSGSGKLIKTNFAIGGTLTLTNANTYSGGTIVGGFTNNTTLAVANATGSGTGSGFVRVLTNGTFSLGAGGPGGAVAAAVITNGGIVRLNRSDDFTFNNTVVGDGAFQKYNTNTVVISGINGFTGGTTINDGALRISNAGALGSGTVVVQNGATSSLQLEGGVTFTTPLRVDSKPSVAANGVAGVLNLSGNNTVASQIGLRQNGAIGWIFESAAGHLLVSGTHIPMSTSESSQTTTRTLWLRGSSTAEWSSGIVDSGDSVRNLRLHKTGSGTWTLSGANTYTGPTVVSNGTLMVNGSLSSSSVVTVQGGILGGTGQINGPVTINAEGTLAPGESIGTLAINNSLILSGTNIMEVSHTGCDKVVGIGNLTLGGSLKIVVNGTLDGSEVFKLFTATGYSGDFAFYDLPALPSPLTWNTSAMAAQGILTIDGGAPQQPTIEPVTVSGTNLVVSLPSTVAGANYVLQSATNFVPVIYWRNESTNTGNGGPLSLEVPIDPGKPAKFLRFWVY